MVALSSAVGVCDFAKSVRQQVEQFGAHPLWRRLTGLTLAQERHVTAKERRAGLARLVAWIKRTANAEGRTTNGTEEGRRDACGATTNGRDACGATTNGRDACGTTNGRDACGTTNGRDACGATNGRDACGATNGRDARSPKGVSFAQRWDLDAEVWACAEQAGELEGLCARLQISSARLSALTREYCGVSARELLDGFKLEKLREALRERFRFAAHSLWGEPGDYALEKIGPHGAGLCAQNSELREGRTPNSERRTRISEKRSRYFSDARECYREDEGAELERRVKELLARFRNQIERERFAAALGFGSAGRMNRACLNVLGRSLRGIERTLAAEVVRYYLCAEDKRIREIALGADSAASFAARELYGESDLSPQPPFLDRWSAAESFARDWLDAMAGAFG